MERPDGRWCTKEELAAALGLKLSGVEYSVVRQKWFNDRRDELTTKLGGRLWLKVPDVVLAWARARLGESEPERKNGTGEAPPPDDPQIRLARVRADREEDRYRRERGELVERSEMAAALLPSFAVVRAGVQVLERRHGDDAGEIIRDAIDAAERKALDYFDAELEQPAAEPSSSAELEQVASTPAVSKRKNQGAEKERRKRKRPSERKGTMTRKERDQRNARNGRRKNRKKGRRR